MEGRAGCRSRHQPKMSAKAVPGLSQEGQEALGPWARVQQKEKGAVVRGLG